MKTLLVLAAIGAAATAKPPVPASPPWEVRLVEAPREIGLGTMSVNVWARVAHKDGAATLPACVLVMHDDKGAETQVDMAPVDSERAAAPASTGEMVATVDTYTWVREASHPFEIRSLSAAGPPQILARGAIRVKARVATPDLVLLDSQGLIQSWVGSGAGGFAPGAPVEVGAPGGAPLVVDVDGDKLLDLAVPTRDGALRFLTNSGNGHFEPGRSISCGPDLAGCAIGDLDGNGRPDLVTVGAAGSLEIRFDLADEPTVSLSLPLAPDCLEIADLDGDHVGEIYAGLVGSAEGEVHVIRRGADGTWGLGGVLAAPAGGRGRIRALQRVPGAKGHPDELLVLSSQDSQGVLESWGRGADTGTEPGLRAGVRLAGEPIAMTIGRFFGEGASLARLVVVRQGRGADFIAIGADDVPRRIGHVEPAPQTIVALDLDGDGDDDLATAADDLRLWIDVGGTEFREAGESPYLLESPVIALVAGSLDERFP